MGSVGSKIERTFKRSSLTGRIYSKITEEPEIPEIPEPEPLPPPVEEVDLEAQKELGRSSRKRRKGRSSTILSKMGSTNTGKKTVLG
jgi:hypothetical protein